MRTGKIYYNSTTGEIVGSFYPDKISYSQYPKGDNLSFIETNYELWDAFLNQNNGKTMKVIDGEFVAEEKQVSLEDLKNTKINQIEALRKSLQYVNIAYRNITLIATEKARDNLFKAAIISKGLGVDSLSWLDANNKPVTLSLDDANTIIAMLMQRDSLLYLKEGEIKLAIDACISADDTLDKTGNIVSQGVNSIQIQF